jgi:hypothetical protein
VSITNRADQFLATYDRLDAALVKAGWPATSPWWRAELERFIRSGKRRWVIRVGRRGGKSSTLCRVAICQAITPGLTRQRWSKIDHLAKGVEVDSIL